MNLSVPTPPCHGRCGWCELRPSSSHPPRGLLAGQGDGARASEIQGTGVTADPACTARTAHRTPRRHQVPGLRTMPLPLASRHNPVATPRV